MFASKSEVYTRESEKLRRTLILILAWCARVQIAAKLDATLAAVQAAQRAASATDAAAAAAPDDAATATSTAQTDGEGGSAGGGGGGGGGGGAAAAVTVRGSGYYGADCGASAMPAFARDMNIAMGVPIRVWGKDIKVCDVAERTMCHHGPLPSTVSCLLSSAAACLVAHSHPASAQSQWAPPQLQFLSQCCCE
jgi:hypothetical protein